MDCSASQCATFIESVFRHAERDGDHLAVVFQPHGDGEAQMLSYRELRERVTSQAEVLRSRGLRGQPVALLYPTSVDFVVGFLACLYSGAVAVPLNLSRNTKQFERLVEVLSNSQASAVMTTESTRQSMWHFFAEAGHDLSLLDWIDESESRPGRSHLCDLPDAEDLAFIQYTSGSTSQPKGVMVSHANIVANQEAIRTACDHPERLVAGGWLPQFHDMGLIGHMMQPLYLGGTYVFMPPMTFMQRPRRWLELISRYRIHSSAAPDFGYQHCVNSISEREDLSTLDLSCWKVALNGSEPVDARTMRRFTERFSEYRFDGNAFFPCYGMAETTLFVSGGPPGRGVRTVSSSVTSDTDSSLESSAPEVVSCGKISDQFACRIVDPETGEVCDSGSVGEIWLRGSSVTQGYWHSPDQTRETFNMSLADVDEQQGFLRTGDLGFLLSNELYVTGRRKEVIILRGRNLYPYDIERTCNEQPAASGHGAVAVALEKNNEPTLGVVIEVKKSVLATADIATLKQDFIEAITLEHGVIVGDLLLVKPGTIPRTTSGKLRRLECRTLFQSTPIAET